MPNGFYVKQNDMVDNNQKYDKVSLDRYVLMTAMGKLKTKIAHTQ